MTMAAMFKAMDAAKNIQRPSTLPEGRPAHFFKIVLPTVIIDKKLRFLMKFVEDYGKDFPSTVTLCDPNCCEWQVRLEKSGDDVWFCDGWERFADFYSISTEFLLVFRYEGYYKFHVLIFDMSGSEIQYPCNDSKCNNARVEDDDQECSPKSFKNDHDYDCDDADYDNNNDKDDDYRVESDDSEDNRTEDNDFINNESSSPSQSPSRFHPRGRSFTKCFHGASKWTPTSSSQRKRKSHETIVYESDQEDNQTEDNDFINDESSSPSQSPSHSHFTKFIDGASKWPPKSSSQRKRKRHGSTVYESDQEDNQTEDYDFIKDGSSSPSQSPSRLRPRRRYFTKFIDGASKWPPAPSSQRKGKRHESNVYGSNQSEDINVKSNHRTPKSSKQHSGYRFRFKEVEHTQWRRNPKSISKHYRAKHISTEEKDKVLRAALKYKPKFPYFRDEVRPQYIYNKFMYVPADFGSRYLDGRPELITLETFDGKQWPARCFFRDGSGSGRNIGKGWAKFCNDNDLQVGDQCVFELINPRKIVFKVRIFRMEEYKGR